VFPARDRTSPASGPNAAPADRQPARILVADDHPVVLFALENLIGRFAHLAVVGRAQSFPELFDAAERLDFDVALTDLHMPCAAHYDVRDMLSRFRQRYADESVVVLTTETDPTTLRRVLDLPIDGLLSKKDRIDLIPVAIASAMARECYVGPVIRELLARARHAADLDGAHRLLSRREREVLTLYASGLSVTEIAARLGRSIKTISAQKCSAMKKLSLSNDIELYRFAAEHGLGVGKST